MWAALFPGQGSQYLGMGKYLYEEFPFCRTLFEEAGDLLSLDIKKLCHESSEEELSKTENTQVALLVISFLTYTIAKREWGFDFSLSCGHSVGEYGALVASEALSFQEALPTVRKRGQYMQEAVPLGQGGMMAVQGLEKESVLKLCTWAEEESGLTPLEPAAFNSPLQTVLSGSQKLISWLKSNLSSCPFPFVSKKILLIPLKVSAPFHCSLMKPAEEKMKEVLKSLSFSEAKKPVIQNSSAKAQTEPEELRTHLIRQISHPVRWVESIEELVKMGVKYCVEFGSGQVLTGLIKRIQKQASYLRGRLQVFNTQTLEDFKNLEKIWKEKRTN